ncbi:MAG TPA: response regulator, partial [Bacteroidota bacterium]|nr:response regulator [Bacteroidota bacterium]
TIGTKEDLTPRLKSSGFAVVQSQTPEIALEKIEKVNPNVILCDSEFSEGGLSGMRFLHIVRASAKFNFIPFIFIASQSDVAQLQSSELKPNEGFVKTPVDWEELTTRINEKLHQFREYISSVA